MAMGNRRKGQQPIRATLLASATATDIFGLCANICSEKSRRGTRGVGGHRWILATCIPQLEGKTV